MRTLEVPLLTLAFFRVEPGPMGSRAPLAWAWWPGSIAITLPASQLVVEVVPECGRGRRGR